MLGLYIHIPFCEKKCHYCNFVITRASGPGAAKEQRFLSLFEKEILCRAPGVARRRFDTLYFGGGTPSALGEKELARVFSLIFKNFNFKKNIEITLEANPGDVTPAKARFLKRQGVNRVSLGAQSFHDKTLAMLNRAHRARDIFSSFDALRGAGFGNINLDLMLSLPGETPAGLSHSLEELKRLNPEHVSLYELVIEEKTVFARRFQKGTLDLPGEEASLAMLSGARAFLERHGWHAYELLNHAKRGFESAHNRLYWKNEEYLGLGPGAYSYIKGKRHRHSVSFDQYLSKCSAGDWSHAEEEILGPREREAESFLLVLRTAEGVERRRHAAHLSRVQKTMEGFLESGLVERADTRLRFTERGKLFAESVFAGLSLPDSPILPD